MAATQIGTGLIVSASQTSLTLPNATNYILTSVKSGDTELDMDKIYSGTGALVTLVVYKNIERITVNLLCKNAADPATDYVKGATVTHTGPPAVYWYVEDVSIDKDKSPHKVSVTLVKYNKTTAA
ncbi:MAG: hypothetical protein ABIH03_17160 [Pseudomonadota bacterium]